MSATYRVVRRMIVGGREYRPGDELPPDALKPSSIASLVRGRQLAVVDDHGAAIAAAPPVAAAPVALPVRRGKS